MLWESCSEIKTLKLSHSITVSNMDSLVIITMLLSLLLLGSKWAASRFLDASSHLYKRVCPSVCPSVRTSVCPLRLFRKRQKRAIYKTTIAVANTAVANTATATIAKCIMQNAEDASLAYWPCSYDLLHPHSGFLSSFSSSPLFFLSLSFSLVCGYFLYSFQVHQWWKKHFEIFGKKKRKKKAELYRPCIEDLACVPVPRYKLQYRMFDTMMSQDHRSR